MNLRLLIPTIAVTISMFTAQISSSECDACHETASSAELLREIHTILNNGLLFLPQLQPQLIEVVNEIAIEGGFAGATGATGPTGLAGATGATGATGAAGGILDYADFFALMPPDNAATVAVGGDVDFPQDGPLSGSGLIARTGPDTFNLAAIGVYEVTFQVSVSEAGQLILTLNNADLAYTVAGRATGTSQIVQTAIIETTLVNSILTVRNPAGNSTALTITPLAGGTRPVSAHLVITRIR